MATDILWIPELKKKYIYILANILSPLTYKWTCKYVLCIKIKNKASDNLMWMHAQMKVLFEMNWRSVHPQLLMLQNIH